MTIFLDTERLILKTPELSDLDNLIELRSDPEVMKYIGKDNVQTREDAIRFLKLAIPYQEKYKFGFCSVFEKKSGEFIGQAGLFHLGFDESKRLCCMNRHFKITTVIQLRVISNYFYVSLWHSKMRHDV